MTVEQMRAAIYKVYPSEKWHNRVMKMQDAQVVAIYQRMLSEKKL